MPFRWAISSSVREIPDLQTVSFRTAFAQKQDHRDASVKYRSGYVLDSHYKHREVSPAGGRNQGHTGNIQNYKVYTGYSESENV